MAINLYHEASPLLTGQAAYEIGQGELARQQQEDALRQQDALLRWQQLSEQSRQFDLSHSLDQQRFEGQLSEGARQFDATQAFRQQEFGADEQLRQQQLDAQREEQQFNQQVAKHREQLARRGLGMDFLNNANRLAEVDLRGQYGLASDWIGAQTQLAREGMQQAGQNERMGGQFGLQWQEQAAKQMQADWQNVQKALPKLNPDERQELIGKFYDRWQNANIPMPVEMPEQALPEWMDPQQKLSQARQQYPGVPWQISEKGELMAPRGWNFQMSPEYQQWKGNHDKEMEALKSGSKNEADEQKMYREAAKSEMQQRHEEATLNRQQRADAMKQRTDLAKEIASARLELAKMKAPGVEANGLPKAIPDTSAFEKEIENLEQMLQSIVVPDLPTVPQQSGALPAIQPTTPGVEPQSTPQAGPVTVWSNSELQAALSNPNIPPGTPIVWGPTGKSRAK